MRYYSESKYIGTDIVFLCEIEYIGRTYRFSSFPCVLLNGDDEILFDGGLEDPTFEQKIGSIGIVTTSSSSISMSLTLPFNVAIREMQGRGIDRAKAKLYYVLTKNGKIQQTYESKIALFSGIITDPIYGHPDRETGYVEFSIENDIFVNDTSMLSLVCGDVLFLEKSAYSKPPMFPDIPLTPPADPDGIIDVLDVHKGKVAPAIIGAAGRLYGQDATLTSAGATPAYLIAYENVAPDYSAWYVIAGHDVNAPTVKMYDNQGNSQDNLSVGRYIGARGSIYSFVRLVAGTPIDRSFVANNDREYWIEWDDGGGLNNPTGAGDLEFGGDLIIWALESLGITYDRERWNAAKAVLNEYKFAGYINDPKIKTFEWIQNNIIAYLPVTVAAGPNGLYPIIDYRIDSINVTPRITVEQSSEFLRVSPVEPIIGDRVNNLTVRYGPRGNGGEKDTYMSYAKVTYRPPYETEATYELLSPYSIISFQKFGDLSEVIELDYCYDAETAAKIAANQIKTRALPEKKVSYRAAFRFGFLEVGDIIEITDPDIGLEEYRCQICAKRYGGRSWVYDILLSDNPIDNNRPQLTI